MQAMSLVGLVVGVVHRLRGLVHERASATGVRPARLRCGLFLAVAVWRVSLILRERRSGPRRRPTGRPGRATPSWRPCYDEAEVVAQLIERLDRIDYPADRLQGFLLLEAHDHATIAAALATAAPAWLKVLVVPPGWPQTKPRALNCALAHATGDLLTVYDAEDDPDPAAAARGGGPLRRRPDGPARLLQAPLRIRPLGTRRTAPPFLDRQFAVEYAGPVRGHPARHGARWACPSRWAAPATISASTPCAPSAAGTPGT